MEIANIIQTELHQMPEQLSNYFIDPTRARRSCLLSWSIPDQPHERITIMKILALPVLTALALSVTLAAPVQAQSQKYRPSAPPEPHLTATTVSLLPVEGNKTRKVKLCDTKEAMCREVPLSRKTGKVSQVVHGNFVTPETTRGSWLTISDKWISLCYASASSRASTCTPVVPIRLMANLEPSYRFNAGRERKPYILFTPKDGVRPTPEATQIAINAFYRGMARAQKTLVLHAHKNFMGKLPMKSAIDDRGGSGGSCTYDDHGGMVCTSTGAGAGGNEGGGGGYPAPSTPWEENWPEDPPPGPGTNWPEIQPDIPIVEIPGQREPQPEPSQPAPQPSQPPQQWPEGQPLPPEMLPLDMSGCVWMGRRLVCTQTHVPVVDPADPGRIVHIPGKRLPKNEPVVDNRTLCERFGLFCGWFPDTTPVRSSGYGQVYDEMARKCDDAKAAADQTCKELSDLGFQDRANTRGCYERASYAYANCLSNARDAQRRADGNP